MATTQAFLIETGDKRDGRGRRIATLERRAELVTDFRRSGLTMAAFARREGLRYSTFAGWVLRSGRPGRAPVAPVRFTQVQLPVAPASNMPAGLEVRLVDGTLVRGSTANELAALIRALRS